ncbi:helix-turn-helix transcriptional regulator [Pseudomonas sp. C2B4]|uniref:helix-turn-helix transcriptional regulator n=1 Tax=Pseudomonas sp. C2B4 TaxID=2735270 RepID=UPI001586DC24|nr:helix-turn-helix transcriptional regulator [Pseudomonas sp. C2B4]NUU38227.1 hypothetical protein [Pseudomonas sp. C2B4]
MTLAAFSKARLALARQQPEAALQALDIVERHASELGRGQWRVKVELLRAFALAELERNAEAREYLHSAVASGYRLGLVRTFLDEGEAFQSLLPQLDLADDGVLGDYYRKLVQDLPEAPPIEADKKPSALIETAREQTSLTRREQDIVDLLEQSMSNKRIALTLNLSLQTVKWNLKNIFFKFGVSSRYDAIVVARKRRDGEHT